MSDMVRDEITVQRLRTLVDTHVLPMSFAASEMRELIDRLWNFRYPANVLITQDSEPLNISVLSVVVNALTDIAGDKLADPSDRLDAIRLLVEKGWGR